MAWQDSTTLRLTRLSAAGGHEADETASSSCVQIEFAECDEDEQTRKDGAVMTLQTMLVGQQRQYSPRNLCLWPTRHVSVPAHTLDLDGYS